MSSIASLLLAPVVPIPSDSPVRHVPSRGPRFGAGPRPDLRGGALKAVPQSGQRLLVHVVDSDCARRAALARELYGTSIHVEIYEDLDELIDRAPSQGIALVHADQSFLDEGQFIALVRERAGFLPVAFYAAAPSPEKIVRAMLSGAIDYMQWPSTSDGLKVTMLRMARVGEEKGRVEARRSAARQRVARLTTRERDVLVRVVEGDSNKEIARRLGLSPRTIEIHRGSMLARPAARSTAHAVRIGLDSGLID
jgi:FixJ family two-component response regulator